MIKSSFSGAQYFVRGLNLVRQPGVRHLVLIPLIINFLLLGSACIWLFYNLLDWKDDFYQWSWGWVQWILDSIGWLIWPLVFVALLLCVFYVFAIIANWLSAPFNGLLAEAVERHLSGLTEQPTQLSAVIKDLPRVLTREWSKFTYWLPKALACLLLFFIPGLNLVAPVVWLLFSAWMMAIQYIDYPMDNHKVPFHEMLHQLKANRGGPLGFGGTVMLATLVPVVNILVMPVAVAGATALWYEQYRAPSSRAGSTASGCKVSVN
jgi:CysZ protein